MAGGIDWLRWHHGTVSDHKFQLVAKKAGARVSDVIAVWACLLEAASQSMPRGNPGEPDFESLDCALGLDDGQAQAIYTRMTERGLIRDDGTLTSWDKRQPKREREDDNSTSRVQAFRERKRHETPDDAAETPRNAGDGQETPREEKSREEENPRTPRGGELPGFVRFWAAWPKSLRKEARGKCLEAWQKAGAESQVDLIVAHVERLKASPAWQKDAGQFIPAPLVYLRNRRWEGAEGAANDGPNDWTRHAL